MNRLKQQKLLIDAAGAILCLALLAGGYYFGIQSSLDHKAAITAQHRQLATVRGKSAAARSEIQQLKARITKLKASEPPEVLKPGYAVHTNARLQQITSLAVTRGLTLNAVEPGQSKTDPRYRTTPLRLTGAGSYRGCVQFLHDLRQSFADTTVVNFRFTGSPESPGSPVNFDLDLCWYATSAVASAAQEQ